MSEPSQEQKNAWACQLATSLGSNQFPHIQHTLGNALLQGDPTNFIESNIANKGSEAIFLSFCQVLQDYCLHQEGQVTEARHETQVVKDASAMFQQHIAVPKQQTCRHSTNPDKFSGAEKDAGKRQEAYQIWKSHVLQNLTIDSEYFGSEQRKILYLTSQLTDTAYEHNRANFDIVTKNSLNPSVWPWQTAMEVITTLDGHYIIINISHQACIDFDKLFMQNKPYLNFITEYNTLANKAQKTPAEKISSLHLKVSKELHDI